MALGESKKTYEYMDCTITYLGKNDWQAEMGDLGWNTFKSLKQAKEFIKEHYKEISNYRYYRRDY